MTPEEVHRVGEQEVERIHQEMKMVFVCFRYIFLYRLKVRAKSWNVYEIKWHFLSDNEKAES